MKRLRPRSERIAKLSKTTAPVDEIDFVGLLPPEIAEEILSNLDLESITNCKMVCKRWCSIILASSRMWKVVFKKLRLCVEKAQSPQEVVDFKDIFLRVRNRVQQMQDGEFTCIKAFNSKISKMTCMYYHNGIVAVGGQDGICLWKLEPQLELMLKIETDVFCNSYATCIQFDESILVVGTFVGELIAWKLPAAEKLYTKMQHPSLRVPISAVIFSKELDLVVAAAVNSYVTFWRLTSGQVLVPQFNVRQTNFLSETQLEFATNPRLPNGCDRILICVCQKYYCALNFNSKQISSSLSYNCYAPVDCKKHPLFDRIVSIHVCNSNIYLLANHDSAGKQHMLETSLIHGNFKSIWRSDIYCDEILGLGKKYVCMLQTIFKTNGHKAHYMSIWDLSSDIKVACLEIPGCYYCKKFKMHTCLGDTSWLDGFSGFNDKDALLIRKSNTGKIHVINWSK